MATLPVLADARDQQPVAAARAVGGQPRERLQPLTAPVFELDPRARPAAGLIWGVAALGHDALELMVSRDGGQVVARRAEPRRRPPAWAIERERVEHGAAVVIATLTNVLALVPERVEDHQRRGGRGRCALDCGAAAGDEPAAQASEVGPPRRVEAHELGIEDQPVGHRVGQRRQLGELVGAQPAGPRANRERARVRAYLRAATVELDLHRPALIARQLTGAQQHRGDERGWWLSVPWHRGEPTGQPAA